MHESATLCFFMYFLCMIMHFYASEGILMQGSAKPYSLPPGSRSATLAEAQGSNKVPEWKPSPLHGYCSDLDASKGIYTIYFWPFRKVIYKTIIYNTHTTIK